MQHRSGPSKISTPKHPRDLPRETLKRNSFTSNLVVDLWSMLGHSLTLTMTSTHTSTHNDSCLYKLTLTLRLTHWHMHTDTHPNTNTHWHTDSDTVTHTLNDPYTRHWLTLTTTIMLTQAQIYTYTGIGCHFNSHIKTLRLMQNYSH